MWREQINFIIRYAIFGIVRRVKYVYSRKRRTRTTRSGNLTREIRQQPELWQETVTLYHENQTALENFLKEVQAKAQGKRTRVIFTGAGTSQYVGDTVVPYLRAHGDTQAFSFESIGTTDIVAKPEDYLIKDEPTLLVSFARSGNSPESLAAVEVANQVVETIHHLAITCAEEGQLAQISQKEENSFYS